jgi:hypothetical protein
MYLRFIVGMQVLAITTTFCSEPPGSSKSPIELLFSKDGSINARLIADINKVPAGGYVGLENPFLMDKKFIEALVNAAKRKVEVQANLGRGTKNATIEALKKAGVHVHTLSDVHAKRLVAINQNPNIICVKGDKADDAKDTQATGVVYIGSHNYSNISWAHQEMMVKDTSKESMDAHYKEQQALATGKLDKKLAVRSPIRITPKKQVSLNSREKELGAGKVNRIKSLLENMHPNDTLDITSMTFDAQDITDALEAVAHKAKETKITACLRLILDASALKHRDLLDVLHAAGIKVFIYNQDKGEKIFGRFPKLQHTKLFVRYRHTQDPKHLVIVSTGNCANRSNEEFNVDAYYPGDEKMYKEMRSFIDTLQTLCVPYKPIPAPVSEDTATSPKNKKRKTSSDQDENQSQSNKKQKASQSFRRKLIYD